MKLDPILAQSIVDRMMESIPYNINMMNEHGYIIASGDKKRINTLHVGAVDAIAKSETLPMIQSYGTHGQPGVNIPVQFQNQTIGVIGITGDPDKVTPLASLLKISTELLLTQSYNNQMETQHKNRLNRFLYQWTEVMENIETQIELNIEAKLLQVDLTIKRYAIVVETNDISLFSIKTTDYTLALSPHSTVIITASDNAMKTYLKKARTKHIPTGIGNKTTLLGKSVKQAQNTIRVTQIFNFHDTNFYHQISFIDNILSTNLSSSKTIEKFNTLYQTDSGRELIDTLSCYFEQNGSVTETSEQLHIHRNTTNYRLNKISEYFDLDLHILDETFKLYVNYIFFQELVYKRTH
ncbi:CdaR family transcriptional regulator [Companilactobacillus hulinensis]|uniref:CdaR family transcriptional regulator n=1 Tax=Companilactobacillus hulinensis TaxID=2486007 RepID=UPI000F79D8E6|nr:sugar diacid recognition domain-containing protein [Companilactobacillus hulinensis]